MNSQDVLHLLSPDVLIWMLPCVLVCIGIGAVIGRGFALRNLSKKMKNERADLVTALQTLLQNTAQLCSDVGNHGTELQSMEQSVHDVDADGDLHEVQQRSWHKSLGWSNRIARWRTIL